MSWASVIRTLHREVSESHKHVVLSEERTAIHSGKLGDVIYALPTCRALGVNHLVLNIEVAAKSAFSLELSRAKELIPLLLEQRYLNKVSLCESAFNLSELAENPEGIHYNLDMFQRVDALQVPSEKEKAPGSGRTALAHLAQICAHAQGTHVDLSEPWLTAPAAPASAPYVVVSVAPRWRSFSPWYWQTLVQGLPKVYLVGLPHELKPYRLEQDNIEWVQAKNHLDLATLISGAQLFLGNISFPYALAEGLKVKRAVELCYRRMDAYPVGPNGHCLPTNVMKARRLVADLLGYDKESSYSRLTRQMDWKPKAMAKNRMAQARLWLGQILPQPKA